MFGWGREVMRVGRRGSREGGFGERFGESWGEGVLIAGKKN